MTQLHCTTVFAYAEKVHVNGRIYNNPVQSLPILRVLCSAAVRTDLIYHEYALSFTVDWVRDSRRNINPHLYLLHSAVTFSISSKWVGKKLLSPIEFFFRLFPLRCISLSNTFTLNIDIVVSWVHNPFASHFNKSSLKNKNFVLRCTVFLDHRPKYGEIWWMQMLKGKNKHTEKTKRSMDSRRWGIKSKLRKTF